MDSYSKIINISNALYNDGLEKAKVRDLSGAIQSLKKACVSTRRIHRRGTCWG